MANRGTRTSQRTRKILPADRAGDARHLLAQLGEVVYAVRTKDGLVKIGYTTDLGQRVNFYGGRSAILAWRPGSRDDERAIHQSLRGLAARGQEYYPWHPNVVAIVNDMRADLGIPALTEGDRAA